MDRWVTALVLVIIAILSIATIVIIITPSNWDQSIIHSLSSRHQDKEE